MNTGEIVSGNPPRLNYKIIQSPMAGVTDLAFRRIARKFGCPIAFTEMVKDRSVVKANRRTIEMLSTAEWDRPLGVQLVGRDPVLLCEAAKRLEQLGADVIDLNLGCPVPKVVKTGCGAALLKEPELVGRLVEAMVRAVRVPVTVKMRTDGDDRFLAIAKIAAAAGVAAITIHGRTREQMYKGFSNHGAIRAVKEAVAIPVIGNGDIRSGTDARRMAEATGCDGVMIARGALGNPWIYRDVEAAFAGAEPPAPPTPAERAAVLREHFAFQREYCGDEAACRLIRRVVHWFVKGLPGAAALRARGNKIESTAAFEALTEAFGGGSS